ncbi:MAG: hypothetical protein WCP45_13450 [Verrucomicrobiota bacterium]
MRITTLWLVACWPLLAFGQRINHEGCALGPAPVVPVKFINYPNESDLDGGAPPIGLYPVPANLPVETWPVGTGALTLFQYKCCRIKEII